MLTPSKTQRVQVKTLPPHVSEDVMDKTRLRKLLERDEGFRAKPYLDTEGILTIGVGIAIGVNPVLGKTYKTERDFYADYPDGIKKARLDAILDKEIDERIEKMASAFADCWDDLNDVRKEVIVSLAFNLGNG